MVMKVVVLLGKVPVLTKIIFKMLFKATIPVVIIAGVMSYGMYMRGGDPAGLFKKLVGNSVQSAKSSIQGAGDSFQSMSPVDLPNSKTTVYQWVDENGNTQFGSTPPEGIDATAKTYNNNANLMAGTPAQKQPEPNVQSPGQGPDGNPLPGVAGMNLPVAVDPAALSEFLQTVQPPQQ